MIPFAASYRPFWLGLGTLSFDLLLAVTITSMLRRRIGHRSWRLVHWLSYASLAGGRVHGLGTGSDVKSTWLLGLTALCTAAVWLAIWMRVSSRSRACDRSGYAPLLAAPLALILWLPHGPLGKGWARRAGTPSSLLVSHTVTVASRTSTDRLPLPFSGDLTGSVRQSQSASGLAAVDLSLSFSGSSTGVADVLLEGQPLAGGGVSVSTSRVTVGTSASPRLYSGRVVQLDGGRIIARIHDASGSGGRLELSLNVNPQAASVTGTINATKGSA